MIGLLDKLRLRPPGCAVSGSLRHFKTTTHVLEGVREREREVDRYIDRLERSIERRY